MINFIIAQAADDASKGGFDFSGVVDMLPLILICIVGYFFMIRPGQKQQKEINRFRNSLEKGAKVVTAGGIYGTVKVVEEETVTIEIAHNVEIKISKSMIMQDPSTVVAKTK